MDEIKGEIEHITYRNDENGYTVANLKVNENKKEGNELKNITVVGYLPFINDGDSLKLTGSIVIHKEYGKQFKISTFEKLLPETEDSIERYLSNGPIKGIGPSTAKKIVKAFGKDTLNVLRFEYDKLTRIKGISLSKAKDISEMFNENWEIWKIVGYLEKYGISVQNAKNVYERLGTNAIEEIEKNPYLLVEVVNNVDFKMIDKKAMEAGIPYNFGMRIESGIKYALNTAALNGHCCVLKESLEEFIENMLAISSNDFEDSYRNMIVKKTIVEEIRLPEIVEEIKNYREDSDEKNEDDKSDSDESEISEKEEMYLNNTTNELVYEPMTDDMSYSSDDDYEAIGSNSDEEQIWTYLMTFYEAEDRIANKLITLNKHKNIKKIKNIEKEIKESQKNLDIKLSKSQIQAVKAINDNNVCVITGGPGTGKTTIIKTIISIFKKHHMKPVLCSPTGRAAKRMTEVTGEEATTLHRRLEIGKIEDQGIYGDYGNYDVQPIDADLIIVDEMSMVDIFLMEYLMKAIYNGTKLILVGDYDQLQSVGPGNVLKDIIISNKIKTITLNKIFRQAAKSKIVLNSHRVNNGLNFLTKTEISDLEEYNEGEEQKELNNDFFFINEDNPEKVVNEIVSLSTGRLKKYKGFDFLDNIQILTPTKKGILGTKELNQILQQILNPFKGAENEKKYGDNIFRISDRVMQIKNNYDITWEKPEEIDEEKRYGSGIYNGELGRVIKVTTDNSVKVKFDDNKCALYTSKELDQLELAYVETIHKAQGSEFDVVIMVLPRDCSKILLTRNLLYTGITRAKSMLIVIGKKETVDFMINNVNIKKRNTGLAYKLKIIEQNN